MNLFPEGFQMWRVWIAVLAVIGIVYAAGVALRQRDLKFVIGYSSVSHMGFVLFGFATANVLGVSGAVLQMFSHGVIGALLFAVAGRMVYRRTHTRDLDTLSDMGLGRALPFAAFSFVIASAASMGIPGFSGFAAEITILIGAWKAYPLAVWITGTGMVLVAAFTLRALKQSFFGEVSAIALGGSAAPSGGAKQFSTSPTFPTSNAERSIHLPENLGPITIAEKCGACLLMFATLAVGAVLMLPQQATLLHGMLVITPLTSLFKIICLALAFFTVLLARSDRSSRNPGEYLAMLLLATIGLMLLVGTEELLMIFIGLELTSLSLYIITAFDKSDVRSAEAGLKYFLFGSTASAFTLFGLSFIYGMSGTTGLAAIGQKFATQPMQPLLFVGILMTLVGLAFKVAAAPFHLWAPDAYQGAPVPSAAFIASGSKVASFVVLGKIVLVGFAPVHGSAAWHAMIAGWSPVLAALAALSILLGNLVALVQTNVRRLLAYSAVAHAGYTLLGLVAGGRDGFSATLFYTTVYAFT